MPSMRIPGHVSYSGAEHGGAVLINVRSGRCYALNPTADAMWRVWRDTGDFEAAVAMTAANHPVLPRHRIRDDAWQLATALADRGLVMVGHTARQRGRRSADVDPLRRARLHTGAVYRSPHRAVIPIAVGLGLLQARLPFGFSAWLLRTIRRRCQRSASPHQVAVTIAALRRGARWCPGRFACLELSLATVAAMAIVRCRVELVIGVADDPHRFHAWVETAGTRVPVESDPEIDEFRRILII